MNGRRVLRQWGLWMALPVLVLAVLAAAAPWPGAARTMIFVVGVLVWGVFIARPRLD